MGSVYKYRANLFDKEKGYRQDTESLKNREFFAAKLKEMNDPFEGSVGLSVAQQDSNWTDPIIRKIASYGVYSLSKPKENEEFPQNELMWAHYGDSHRGFCIEYDLTLLQDGSYVNGFDISDTINVSYEDENPQILEPDNAFSVRKKAFGVKSKAWVDENEIRLVFETRGVKPIADNAIKAIYFGIRMELAERQNVINSLKGRNVKFYQINRVGDLYKLDAIELDTDLISKFEYEIISTRHNNRVENYTILYKSEWKDKSSMQEFINFLRSSYVQPTNFTIIDDIRVDAIIEKQRDLYTNSEERILIDHWIAYSSFDAPEFVWMYPEKWNK